MNKPQMPHSPRTPPADAVGNWDLNNPAPIFFRAPVRARFQQMTDDGQVIHEITDDDVIKAVLETPSTTHPPRRADDEPMRKRRPQS